MSEVDEVKARLDIVEYISEHVPLKKAGRNFKGLCPFHGEKTPSFVVFPETQTWRCFGCGEGGDIFNFAMKREGWGFREALEALAERAGVELRQRHNRPEDIEKYDRLRELLAEATTYFHHMLLNADEAEAARCYVAGRKLNDDTARAFMLGYAPNSWDATRTFLQSKDYTEAEIIEAGLMVVREEEGKRYDRFRHRLMIPIRDARGRTVGFGARALRDEDKPKYLNSPQGEIFDKSRILYGMDMSRRAIREQETAVLVEGYMDVMQAHQAGFGNLVAQMGTALTETQLAQLSKYARRLILALDPDAAGMRATMRDLEVARETLAEQPIDTKGMIVAGGRLNIDIRVLTLPQGKDPDALIRDAPDEWRRLLDAAVPVADYVIRKATEGSDLRDPFERERLARELLPILAATESQVQSYSNVQALARVVRIPETTLIQWASQQPKPKTRRRKPRDASMEEPPPRTDFRGAPLPDDDEAVARPTRPSRPRRGLPNARPERYCLAVLIKRPAFIYQVDRRLQELKLPRLQAEDFTQPELQEIFRAFQASLAQDALEPLDYMYKALVPVGIETLEALLQIEDLDDLDSEKGTARALMGILRLRATHWQRRCTELEIFQMEAQDDGNLTRVEELGTIISQLTQELRRLETALPYDKSATRSPDRFDHL
jgi:DNA primase